VCLPGAYNDGGCSGATMDRPALQWLLADIAAGRVDTVVVYKIDRLTRSLADFAKIVEVLEAMRSIRSVKKARWRAASACRSPWRTASAHPISRGVRLSYLAPDITQAILGGRQPRGLPVDKLLALSRLPLAWHEQRLVLGFA
jgi:Resolvase, N terminal domain